MVDHKNFPPLLSSHIYTSTDLGVCVGGGVFVSLFRIIVHSSLK